MPAVKISQGRCKLHITDYRTSDALPRYIEADEFPRYIEADEFPQWTTMNDDQKNNPKKYNVNWQPMTCYSLYLLTTKISCYLDHSGGKTVL